MYVPVWCIVQYTYSIVLEYIGTRSTGICRVYGSLDGVYERGREVPPVALGTVLYMYANNYRIIPVPTRVQP